LAISPDKSEVYSNAGMRNFLYHTKTGNLRDLSGLIAPYSESQISPDWHYLEWTNWAHRDPAVHIINLRDFTVRTISLTGTPGQKSLPIVDGWSPQGEVLVTMRPYTAGIWTYWKIDPVSGVFKQIYGQSPTCQACEGTRVAGEATAPSGASAYLYDGDLTVRDPDDTLHIVQNHIAPTWSPGEAVAACFDCGTNGIYPQILGILDGDVLLYQFEGELWVYGITEHERSPLGLGFSQVVF
jgi:hypothetical protein